MTTMLAVSKQQWLKVCSLLGACVFAASAFAAQAPAPRISDQVNTSNLAPLQGTLRSFAQPQFDAGRMPSDARLTGITIAFNRTPAQQAALDQLILDQQNPASPLYHQWLTPEQFAARFGMAQADIDKVTQWLEQQGFSIDSIGRSGTMIHFSGTVNQIELAFQTQMHYYNIGGQKLIAPSTALSVPSGFVPVIDAIRDISTFRPRDMHITAARSGRPAPQYTFYTGTNTQAVLFAPGDVRVAYDMNPLLTANFNGTGQTIAVMGQSEISVTDIENFQNAAGFTVKDPNLILVPNTGSPAVSSGDEGESDLDLEWAGAMAPGATIDLVYAGSTSQGGVYDSISYAVDSKIGDIISVSYGSCEPELVAQSFNIDAILQQASTQGQTIIASSGDFGSTGCFGFSNLSLAVQQAAAVNYPASSPYVTGVGGTEITPANDAVGTYWGPAPSENTVALTSALSWIPEVVWNDDVLSGASANGGLSATGGGISTLYAQPSWQTSYFTATSETNPGSAHRLVPDVALYSSPNYPGFLYCTSDQSDWSSGQVGSCGNNEFYDPTSFFFTVAGGTSFAAPIFAGMVAVINQKQDYTHGQGLINPELYTLAANSSTYQSAFHDVTSGNNFCTAGTTFGYCSASGATVGYAATTGYDPVTGLGSVDLNNLASAWAASGTTLIGTTISVVASVTAPAVNQADNITFTVASDTGATVPTGTISVSEDGGVAATYTLASNGTYVLAESFTAAGTHTFVAQYSGDATHDVSTGAITITVGGGSSGTGSFGLTATSPTVVQGSTTTSTVTITPAGGYLGTINFQLETSSSSLTTNGCYNVSNATVTGAGAITASIQLITNSSLCNTAVSKPSVHRFAGYRGATHKIAKSDSGTGLRKMLPAGAVTLAGLLLFGLRKRRAAWLTTLGCFLLLALVTLAVGCGSSSSSSGGGGNTSGDVAVGSYPITVVGTDTVTSSITAQASFTLTVTAQ